MAQRFDAPISLILMSETNLSSRSLDDFLNIIFIIYRQAIFCMLILRGGPLHWYEGRLRFRQKLSHEGPPNVKYSKFLFPSEAFLLVVPLLRCIGGRSLVQSNSSSL